MPSTFVHALLPTACLFTLKSAFPSLNRIQWIKLLVLSVILGNAPDLDIIPASIWYQSWEKIHREWGHNIFSVGFMIWMGAQAIRYWISNKFTVSMALAISASLVVSHLFLDSMHAPNQLGHLCGVPLFYPFTDAEYRLPWQIFPAVKIDRSLHFLWAHVSSRQFWHQALFLEVSGAALLYSIYLGFIVAIRSALSHLRKPKQIDCPSE